jgi:hypothetical protein
MNENNKSFYPSGILNSFIIQNMDAASFRG